MTDKQIERSFGVIPIQSMNGFPHVLMVQHQKGHWGFPKGRAEEGEKPRETARRELLEETGLKVRSWLSPHQFQEEYQFERDGRHIHKEVLYFPALVYGTLRLQQEELKESAWLKASELSSKATFPEMKNLTMQIVLWLLKGL